MSATGAPCRDPRSRARLPPGPEVSGRASSMFTRTASLLAALGLASMAGCLDPLVDDEVSPARLFGDPDVDPAAVRHVEDDPAHAAKVAAFATSVAYLRGFADGAPINYWNVDGPQSDLIAPAYVLVDAMGRAIERPVIDVIPGDTGYTPWWRKVEVRVTERYAGERLWSRDAIEAAVRAGLVEEPRPTEDVLNCPVILRDARVPVSDTETVEPVWVWYRGQRVHWVDFGDPEQVPITEKRMPAEPVYLLQRINEGHLLYEFVVGFDLDGDDRLVSSNNIFASGPGGPRYSPLWYVVLVRTTADYLSIDGDQGVGLTAEAQFYDPERDQVISSNVLSLIPVPNLLVNCPIQRVEGSL